MSDGGNFIWRARSMASGDVDCGLSETDVATVRHIMAMIDSMAEQIGVLTGHSRDFVIFHHSVNAVAMTGTNND